jgi:hypothetical protein
MAKGLAMEEVISAPRSPWQNPYAERVIGYGNAAPPSLLRLASSGETVAKFS